MIAKQTTTTMTAGLLALCVPGILIGHTDDPKERDREPVYEGPAYRSALGGAPVVGFPAEGVELMAWLPAPEFGTGANSANDCWGYVSPSGREYAIIGLSNATGFVEITNPANPDIVATIASSSCTWHDIKVFEDYAYVVSECGRGIQVIDMSAIDSGTVTLVREVTTGGSDSHNVALNEDSGYLYRTGGSGNGLLIYDLNADPSNPQLVASWPDRYVHDAQVVTYTEGEWAGREIAFCCSGFNGGGTNTGIDILDVTDKANIVSLSRYEYPDGAYSHQGWLSPDKRYFYLNDEADEQSYGFNTTTHILDVSDLANPVQVTTFSSGSASIDHNLYMNGDLIFEANYRSGLRVFDASDPLAPVEIAYFDTYPENDNASFNGLWSNYPFFPSGIVIGSDIEKGLFVRRVRESQVTFEFPNGLPDRLEPDGDAVVARLTGDFVVETATLHYDLGDGLVETPLVPLGDDLYEATFPSADCGAGVRYYFSSEAGDGVVETSPPGAPAEAYDAVFATDIVVAFEDDMETDRGWSVENQNLTDGAWERGVPAGDGTRGDPTDDADGSGQAWLTGNRSGNSDVDGGPTRLISPIIALAPDVDPLISYARWFTNDDGDQDRLDVDVSNDGGDTWTLVESVGSQGGWQVNEFRLSDFLPPTADVRLRFSATDNPNDSVTEAGVDAIRVVTVVCDDDVVGDVNGDGVVNFEDLLDILAAWGPCKGCPEDLTGDGAVDFADILVVLANWS